MALITISIGALYENFMGELVEYPTGPVTRIYEDWIIVDEFGRMGMKWRIDWTGCSAARIPNDDQQRKIRFVEALLQSKYLVSTRKN